MAINKLYIAKVEHNWTNHDSNLLNFNNIKKVINLQAAADYHTSIEDLRTQNIQEVCNAAQEIIVVEMSLNDLIELDLTDPIRIYSYSRLLYTLDKLSFKVTGLEFLKELNLQKFNNLAKGRDTDLQVLWTVGCSFTNGTGVSQNQRWGHLLSEYLNIPEVTLSSNGSSIRWAADQILRSDIRSGDIVVWGLTSIQRYEWSENWQLKSNTLGNMHRVVAKPFHYWKYEYFDSITHISLCIREILHVIHYCKKIGAKLYLANLIDVGLLPIILADYENFIDLTTGLQIKDVLTFIDVGSDNLHPGPKQQKLYADQIFNLLTKTDRLYKSDTALTRL